MSEDVEDREHFEPPKPPSLGVAIAVFLELAMVTTFVYERSIVGLVLAAGYAWFSATRAVLFDRWVS